MDPETERTLRDAYHLIKRGHKDMARARIVAVLARDRDNIDAWWLAAHAATSPADIRLALAQVRRLDPQHAPAAAALAYLDRAYPLDAALAPDALVPLPPPGHKASPLPRRRRGHTRWVWNGVLVVGLLALAFGVTALISQIAGMTWIDELVDRAGETLGVETRPGARGELGRVVTGPPDAPRELPVTQRKPASFDSVLVGSLRPDEAHVWTFSAQAGAEVAAMIQFTRAGDARHVMVLRDAAGTILARGDGTAQSATITLVHALPQTGTYEIVLAGSPDGARGDYALGVSLLR